MTTESGTLIDQLWANALARILPATRDEALRPELGDQIDLIVLQAATSRLVGENPGFARILYTAAYDSAERNAYFIIRRLGMPGDFFWKFDQWSEERATKTIGRVVDRIFAELLDRHSAGRMTIDSVDVDRGRFEISFDGCAECRGTSVSRPTCFFHAGTFAGIMGSMLNRRMHAVEVSCEAVEGGPCRFLLGDENDRRVSSRAIDALESNLPMRHEIATEIREQTERLFVDVRYYQLLLGTAFLPNLDVLESACVEVGRKIGHDVAKQLQADPALDLSESVPNLFKDLRYMNLDIVRGDTETIVRAGHAPESYGALSRAAVVPIFCGEIESLLNDLGDVSVRFDSVEREGETLLLRFVPQV